MHILSRSVPVGSTTLNLPCAPSIPFTYLRRRSLKLSAALTSIRNLSSPVSKQNAAYPFPKCKDKTVRGIPSLLVYLTPSAKAGMLHWPWQFPPKAAAVPSLFSKTVCSSPTATCVKVIPSGGPRMPYELGTIAKELEASRENTVRRCKFRSHPLSYRLYGS